MIRIIGDCKKCGHAHEVDVNRRDYAHWLINRKQPAAKAMPYLKADELAFLTNNECMEASN
jgi:hypothetical protein